MTMLRKMWSLMGQGTLMKNFKMIVNQTNWQILESSEKDLSMEISRDSLVHLSHHSSWRPVYKSANVLMSVPTVYCGTINNISLFFQDAVLNGTFKAYLSYQSPPPLFYSLEVACVLCAHIFGIFKTGAGAFFVEYFPEDPELHCLVCHVLSFLQNLIP